MVTFSLYFNILEIYFFTIIIHVYTCICHQFTLQNKNCYDITHAVVSYCFLFCFSFMLFWYFMVNSIKRLEYHFIFSNIHMYTLFCISPCRFILSMLKYSIIIIDNLTQNMRYKSNNKSGNKTPLKSQKSGTGRLLSAICIERAMYCTAL